MSNKTDTKTVRKTESGERLLSYRRFKEGVDYAAATNEEMVSIYDMELQNIEDQINRNGRPATIETPHELRKAYLEYLKHLRDANNKGIRLIPGVEGFASFIGIHRGTFNRWENSNFHGFGDTIKEIKNSMASIKMQLGENNKIPALVLAMDMNNNHGYTQKQEITLEPKQSMSYDINPEQAAKFAELPED